MGPRGATAGLSSSARWSPGFSRFPGCPTAATAGLRECLGCHCGLVQQCVLESRLQPVSWLPNGCHRWPAPSVLGATAGLSSSACWSPGFSRFPGCPTAATAGLRASVLGATAGLSSSACWSPGFSRFPGRPTAATAGPRQSLGCHCGLVQQCVLESRLQPVSWTANGCHCWPARQCLGCHCGLVQQRVLESRLQPVSWLPNGCHCWPVRQCLGCHCGLVQQCVLESRLQPVSWLPNGCHCWPARSVLGATAGLSSSACWSPGFSRFPGRPTDVRARLSSSSQKPQRANAVRCPRARPQSLRLSDQEILDHPAVRRHNLLGWFEVERDRLADIAPRLFECIALGDAARQRGDINRVAAFVGGFKDYFHAYDLARFEIAVT